jgi:hypothetical protein
LFASNAARPAAVNGASRAPGCSFERVPPGVFANDSIGETRSQCLERSRASNGGWAATV